MKATGSLLLAVVGVIIVAYMMTVDSVFIGVLHRKLLVTLTLCTSIIVTSIH